MAKTQNKKFAVIKIAGTQVKVSEGSMFEVNKLEGLKGDTMVITDVLLVVDGEAVKVGSPVIEGAKVTLTVDSQKKGEKIDSFRYKSKSRFRKRHGSRPEITRVKVEKIEA
jgi:large subunit ribosomal protein L21